MLFLFSFLSPIFAAALAPAVYSGTVQNSANDMVTNTRKIANTTAPYQYCAMLLEIVVNTRDICGYFLAIRQTYSGYLTQC